jgi:hypothetical protein
MRPFKLRWLSNRKHYMWRRHSRHTAEEVVDEESRASRGGQAQTHEDKGEAKKWK